MNSPSNKWERFEQYAGDLIDRNKVPGSSYALAYRGDIQHEGGFGFRDREQGLPTTPETVYGIGSCTKSFTALCIMQLAERGLLSVEDPIVQWLPEFRVPNQDYRAQMTIHHFLTHTSGLPPLPTLFSAMARSLKSDPTVQDNPNMDVNNLEPVETFEELVEFIANLDVELLGPPGEYFSYSNDAFALLGTIIERASGQSYRQCLQEQLLDPMGLNRTTLDVQVSNTYPEVTQLYAPKKVDGEDAVVPAPGWWELPAMEAAGRLVSNVRDMIRYTEVYRNWGTVYGTRIVTRESIERMTTPHVEYLSGAFYGYGLTVQPDYHGMTLVGHGGGIKGVDAHFVVGVGKDTAATVLANLSGNTSSRVALALLNAGVGLPVDTPPRTFPKFDIPAESLREFEGTYTSGEGARVRFFVDEGVLKAEASGEIFAARPFAETRVVLDVKGADVVVQFLMDPSGAARAVSFGLRILKKTE